LTKKHAAMSLRHAIKWRDHQNHIPRPKHRQHFIRHQRPILLPFLVLAKRLAKLMLQALHLDPVALHIAPASECLEKPSHQAEAAKNPQRPSTHPAPRQVVCPHIAGFFAQKI
jgi:hypothetical protein